MANPIDYDALAAQSGGTPVTTMVGSPQGLIEPGNIDIMHRPILHNSDGTTSTVRSTSFNIDGKEVLIPTVGPNGEDWTPQQALQNYRKTGKHLGIFSSVESSNEYAKVLHEQQERDHVGVDYDSLASQFGGTSSTQMPPERTLKELVNSPRWQALPYAQRFDELKQVSPSLANVPPEARLSAIRDLQEQGRREGSQISPPPGAAPSISATPPPGPVGMVKNAILGTPGDRTMLGSAVAGNETVARPLARGQKANDAQLASTEAQNVKPIALENLIPPGSVATEIPRGAIQNVENWMTPESVDQIGLFIAALPAGVVGQLAKLGVGAKMIWDTAKATPEISNKIQAGDYAGAANLFGREIPNVIAGVSMAGEGAEGARDVASGMLEKSARMQYSKALDPAGKKNMVLANRVVPEMIDRGIAFNSHEAGKKLIESKLEEASPKLDQALSESIQGKNTSPQILKNLSDSLKGLRDSYYIKGTQETVNPQAVAKIDELSGMIEKMKDEQGNIPAETLYDLKRKLDKIVAANKGGFQAGAMGQEQTDSINVQKAVANTLRVEFANENPNLKKMNAEVSFLMKAHDLLSDAALKNTNQVGSKGLVTRMMSAGLGAGAGYHMGVVGEMGGAAMGTLLIPEAVGLLRSPAWRTRSAIFKSRLADAISTGDNKTVKYMSENPVAADNALKQVAARPEDSFLQDSPDTMVLNPKTSAGQTINVIDSISKKTTPIKLVKMVDGKPLYEVQIGSESVLATPARGESLPAMISRLNASTKKAPAPYFDRLEALKVMAEKTGE